MKVAAFACMMLALPALSAPRVVPGYDSDDEHESLLGSKVEYVHSQSHSNEPSKSESSTKTSKSSESTSFTTTIATTTIGPTTTASDSTTTTTTTASLTKDPWLTLPLNPNLNVPFYVPTLFGPQPTNTSIIIVASAAPAQAALDANGTPDASAVSADSDERRRSVPLRPAPVNPGQMPAPPLPTVVARVRSAFPDVGVDKGK